MVFFHFSELSPGYSDQLAVGCPVECVLQNRQGKEVATQVKLLPPGSVSFDVSWRCMPVALCVCVLFTNLYVFLGKLVYVRMYLSVRTYVRRYICTYIRIYVVVIKLFYTVHS